MHKTPTTLPVSSAPATGDTPVVALLVADGHAEVLLATGISQSEAPDVQRLEMDTAGLPIESLELLGNSGRDPVLAQRSQIPVLRATAVLNDKPLRIANPAGASGSYVLVTHAGTPVAVHGPEGERRNVLVMQVLDGQEAEVAAMASPELATLRLQPDGDSGAGTLLPVRILQLPVQAVPATWNNLEDPQ